MRYYTVAIIGSRKTSQLLTYASPSAIEPGSVVEVPIKSTSEIGVVIAETSKPKFALKQISNQLDIQLPAWSLPLAQWISEYYSSELSSTLTMMLPRGIDRRRRRAYQPDQTSGQTNLIELSDNQRTITDDISSSSERSHLLYGATGAGKTHIYLSLIKQAVDRGQSAILLLPEIGLSRHLIERIKPVLSVPVIELSSDLSAAQRHTRWSYLLDSDRPTVAVGPRSAVFAPVSNLGLIVVDEAHDSSLIETSRPHYDATYVAAKRCELEEAKLVLGTATPNINQYWLAKKQMTIHRLAEPHYNNQPQQISVVSLRDKSQFKTNRYLCESLLASIKTSLDHSQQSLLFINKRGFAHNAHCLDCGWIMECTTCRLPVVYHRQTHQAQCHTCGTTYPPPSSCAECNSTEIRFDSPGTQRIEQEITKLFPNSSVARADRDQSQPESVLNQADILIGTQLLTKGFDLPRLSTVGVLHADSSLGLPDYTAAETVFQQLRQVIGRNNRRGQGGRTIVQALNPDHHAVQTAVADNFEQFYQTELEQRRQSNYPPFTHLLLIKVRYKTTGKATQKLRDIKQQLADERPELELLGPSPALRQFAYGYDHWQLLLKSNQRSTLVEIANQLQSASVSTEINPMSLL